MFHHEKNATSHFPHELRRAFRTRPVLVEWWAYRSSAARDHLLTFIIAAHGRKQRHRRLNQILDIAATMSRRGHGLA